MTSHRHLRMLCTIVVLLAGSFARTPGADAQTEQALAAGSEAEFTAQLAVASADGTEPHTITLTAPITITSAVDPVYTGTQPLTIEGAGFTLDGGANSRILDVQTAAPVIFENVTITRGRHVTVTSPARGGAIRSDGPVTIRDAIVTDNRVGVEGSGLVNAQGGAVFAEGAVTIERTQVEDNSADATSTTGTANAQGGAIHGRTEVTLVDAAFFEDRASAKSGTTNVNAQGGSVYGRQGLHTVQRSLFMGSHAEATAPTGEAAEGAGLFTHGTSTVVSDSTFIGNLAEGGGAAGGGLLIGSAATISNVTIAANTAGNVAGGLFVGTGGATIDHLTASGNSAPTYANAWLQGVKSTFATVITDPLGGGTNCSVNAGSTTSRGYNYDDDGSCQFGAGTGDVSNGPDPLLGQARNNGDLVAAAESSAAVEAGGDGTVRPTMFPLNGSPLIDAIPPGSCSAAAELDVDQRGVDRPFGAGCDIGAIEAVFPTHGFSDVTPFYDATVRWITSRVNTPNILDGYNDNTFRQTLSITRGQAARMYYRAAGEPDVSEYPDHGFTDVIAFFDDAVTWAKHEGIFDGFDDNTFRHADSISRGNFIRSLYGFAQGDLLADPGPHGFSDVTPFYEAAVRWAEANGLADGFDDNTFRQRNNITRGNTTRITYNLARTPTAWGDTMTAPPNMLFKDNLTG